MDSSYNMGMFSEGIQKWTDTTMLDPSLVTDYWYISDITDNGSKQNTFPLKNDPLKEFDFKMLRLA